MGHSAAQRAVNTGNKKVKGRLERIECLASRPGPLIGRKAHELKNPSLTFTR